MSWSVHFAQDTDVPGIGTATATYTGENGLACSHSDRIDTNTGKGIDDFIAVALERLQKHQEETAATDAVIAKIQAKLNG